MSLPNCPFCNSQHLVSRIFYNQTYSHYQCQNHKYLVTFISLFYNDELISKQIMYKNYEVIFNLFYNLMYIKPDSSNDFIDNKFPLDITITPENIEQKIKKYLTFQ